MNVDRVLGLIAQHAKKAQNEMVWVDKKLHEDTVIALSDFQKRVDMLEHELADAAGKTLEEVQKLRVSGDCR